MGILIDATRLVFLADGFGAGKGAALALVTNFFFTAKPFGFTEVIALDIVFFTSEVTSGVGIGRGDALFVAVFADGGIGTSRQASAFNTAFGGLARDSAFAIAPCAAWSAYALAFCARH